MNLLDGCQIDVFLMVSHTTHKVSSRNPWHGTLVEFIGCWTRCRSNIGSRHTRDTHTHIYIYIWTESYFLLSMFYMSDHISTSWVYPRLAYHTPERFIQTQGSLRNPRGCKFAKTGLEVQGHLQGARGTSMLSNLYMYVYSITYILCTYYM